MTVYVDDPMPIGGKFNGWCHCWTDGPIGELHLFARGLGLKRAWLHISRGMDEFPHYDLSPTMRAKALVMGAEYMDLRKWIAQQPGYKAWIARTKEAKS